MPESFADPPQVEPLDPLLADQQSGQGPVDEAPPGEDQFSGQDAFPPPPWARDVLSDAQKSAKWYPQTLLDVRYEFWSGNEAVAPAAADGTPGSAVKTHAGRWRKTAQWSFERLGDWPVCPHPDTGSLYDPVTNPGGSDVLEYATFTLANPALGAEDQLIYRVSGRYVYGLLTPLNDWGPFGAGATPDKTLTGQENRMQPVQFDRSLLAGF